MHRYIRPEITISSFSVEDIITDSALTPTTAEKYTPANEGVSFADTTYIIEWEKE